MSQEGARTVKVHYAGRSELVATSASSNVVLALDDSRGDIGVRGRIKDPGLFRDAVMTAAAILKSDLRYKGKDRTAYLAYLMKKGKKASAAIWEAQKAYLDHAFADDQTVKVIDPILTVHPDQVSLEVFSRDESAYARLAISNEVFDAREAAHGTTFVSLDDTVLGEIDRLRAYRPVELDASTRPRAASTTTARSDKSTDAGTSRDVDVPYAWLRGFLQVQSAATLPSVTCELTPVDLYNLLFVLKTRKAKKSPRGVRFELIGGARPRLVVEPWDVVLECHGPVHTGPPLVIRTFGRQRLLALARILPYLQSVKVQLLGPGLPVFWVLELKSPMGGRVTLTAAFTGWTESSWASAASFDALMPSLRSPELGSLADSIGELLMKKGPQTFVAIAGSVGKPREVVRAALQLECLRGRVVFDLADGVYRPRDLLPSGIDEGKIRFGSPREAKAHRLLGDESLAVDRLTAAGQVTVTKIHDLGGTGVEIHGEVVDKEAHRSFLPHFTSDLEGRVKDAWCSCATFRRSGMREGPCEHMIALRIAYGRKRAEEEALRKTPEGRKTIRAETRTYVRRDRQGVEVAYRLSLDDRVVYVEWKSTPPARALAPSHVEAALDPTRHQRIWFDSDHEARDAYFRRIEALVAEGYVDADTAIA
jgi:hypothetical protein